MAKLINYLATWIGLIGVCALAASAGHRKYTEKDDPCRKICSQELPSEEKACFMIPMIKKVARVGLKCAACREMIFCNSGKCKRSSCGRIQEMSTKRPNGSSRIGAKAGGDFPFRTRRPHNPNDNPCGDDDVPCFIPSPDGDDKWENWRPDRTRRPHGDEDWENWRPDRTRRPNGDDKWENWRPDRTRRPNGDENWENWRPDRTRRPDHGGNDLPWKRREHLHRKNGTNHHHAETDAHDSKDEKSRQGNDPICKKAPCQVNAKVSEHICAKVKAKNNKGPATVVTLRSRKCMEWSNKCEPESHFHYYELCHEGDCDKHADASLNKCP